MTSPKSVLIACAIATTALCITAALLFHRLRSETIEAFTPRRMNVILIIIDALRADHLDLYGYGRTTSKEIGTLADDGVIFENALSPSSWTRPSTASIMTSLYPSAHGAVTRDGFLYDEYLTIQEILKDNGYATAGFYANGNAGEQFGFGQGFDIFRAPPNDRGDDKDDLSTVSASAITDYAVQWLNENEDTPFFLYLFYVDPHAPYYLNEEFQFNQSYNGEIDGSMTMLKKIKYDPLFNEEGTENTFVTETKQYIRDLYDGEIAYTDKQIGRLLNCLKNMGLYENTLVILTADHGEAFWEHNVWGHGQQVYQEQLHIPLIIRCPRLRGGKRIDDFVSTIDILPTVLDIVGIQRPAHFQGVSLLPLILGKRLEKRILLAEEELDGDDFVVLFQHGLKLIHNRNNNNYELYDLRTDPHEKRDLAKSKAYFRQRTYEKLKSILSEKMEENTAFYNNLVVDKEKEDRRPISQELQKQLKALGYL